MGEHIGLTLGQTGFHRKFGLRQVQRFAPVARARWFYLSSLIVNSCVRQVVAIEALARRQAFRALYRCLWRFALSAHPARQIFAQGG